MQFDDVLIAGETPDDGPAILELHEEAFGPGRFARAAERVRERAGTDWAMCFTARRGGELIGSVRMSAISVGGVAGHLLGPLAVRPHAKTRGVGGALLARACGEAFEAGSRFVMLVGDEPYYGRHGFAVVDGPVMPGPVDPARLLVRWAGEPLALAGPLAPRVRAP